MIDCVDLAGNEGATGKTLGTDLRKGKFTLPVLIFLRSATEFERERCCQLVLEERVEEMIELLKNGATNGALNESMYSRQRFDSRGARRAGWNRGPILTPRPCSSSVTALCEMFDQLRV
jgi:hypothetical protein